jgi:hypothetical protein
MQCAAMNSASRASLTAGKRRPAGAMRRGEPCRSGHYVAALEWSTQLDEGADQLKTTPEPLEIRLQSLHPSERAAIKHRLAAKGEVA